jgi:hypothetical protein
MTVHYLNATKKMLARYLGAWICKTFTLDLSPDDAVLFLVTQ